MGCRDLFIVIWYLTLFCQNLASLENPCKSEELVIGGSCQDKPPQNTHELFQSHPVYRERAKQFLSKTSRDVGPQGLLYVQQREMAITSSQDKSVTILGSDDATTCIVAILRHTVSGAVGVVHFDGSGTEKAVDELVHKVKELTKSDKSEGRYELSLAGGVSDPNKIADGVFSGIMNAFHKQPIEVHLMLACIGKLNTREENGVQWPIVYGAGVNIQTWEIFPATFSNKGPEATLRYAAMVAGREQIVNFYDCSRGLYCIGPFSYTPLDNIDDLLKLPDDEFLKRTSTTPKVEAKNYVKQMRDSLIFMKENPDLTKTVFKDGKPHCYSRDEHTGGWIQLKYKS